MMMMMMIYDDWKALYSNSQNLVANTWDTATLLFHDPIWPFLLCKILVSMRDGDMTLLVVVVLVSTLRLSASNGRFTLGSSTVVLQVRIKDNETKV